MVFPPWLQAVLAGVLGVSVTINIALWIHNHAIQKLRADMLVHQKVERHQVRNWLGAIELHLGLLRMVHNEMIVKHFPQDAERLTVPHPPPFDATD